jgi:hypothetical protein
MFTCTPAMLAALADADRPEGMSPWDHSSHTIGAVKKGLSNEQCHREAET